MNSESLLNTLYNDMKYKCYKNFLRTEKTLEKMYLLSFMSFSSSQFRF